MRWEQQYRPGGATFGKGSTSAVARAPAISPAPSAPPLPPAAKAPAAPAPPTAPAPPPLPTALGLRALGNIPPYKPKAGPQAADASLGRKRKVEVPSALSIPLPDPDDSGTAGSALTTVDLGVSNSFADPPSDASLFNALDDRQSSTPNPADKRPGRNPWRGQPSGSATPARQASTMSTRSQSADSATSQSGE